MATIGFRFLSWNLDNFGKFNYDGSMSQIAQTIHDSGADIAVILELYAQGTAGAPTKRVRIGGDLATSDAKTSSNALLTALNDLDPVSKWNIAISGVNTTSDKRDAYAFYWKSNPQGDAPVGIVLPTSINRLEGPTILRYDEKGKDLSFGSSRRPAACKFEMINGTDTKHVWVCGFHASAEFSTTQSKIKANIRDGLVAATAVSAPALPLVIGGDLNLDYKTNNDFYGEIKTSFDFDTALKAGVGTSLRANPNFKVAVPIVTDKAYDNFLFKNIMFLPNWKADVINVVNQIADTLPQMTPDGQKREQNDLEKEAFSFYYTKDNSTVSSISDHFPIIGAFGI